MKAHPDEKPSALTVLCMGMTSSFAGQIIAYPLQLVRTKLQLAPKSSIGKVASSVFNDSGFAGFYRGIGANFLKGIPASALGYVAYEKARSALEGGG